MKTRTVIGPRMKEICRILVSMGGRAGSKSAVYLQLNYRGGSSNRFGAAVMSRALKAGLVEVERWDGPGHPIPVRLTEAGEEAAVE